MEEEVTLGELYRKERGNEDNWETYLGYYRGDWGGLELFVNKVFSVGRALIPQVYFRNPRASLSPKQPGPEQVFGARVAEVAVNNIHHEVKTKHQLKSMCLDSYLYGTAIGKYGYHYIYGTPDEGQIIPGLDEQRDEETGVSYNVNVKKDTPWFLRLHPRRFVVPYKTITLDEVPWVACSDECPTEALRNDPRLRNRTDIPVTGTLNEKAAPGPKAATLANDRKRGENDPMEYTKYWEFYDLRDGKMRIFVEGYDKILYEEDMLDLEGVPFDSLVFNPDEYFFWGASDVIQILGQQKAINNMVNLQLWYWRAGLAFMGYDRGKVEEEDLGKILSEEPMLGVPVDGDPHTAFANFNLPAPPQLMAALEEMEGHIRDTIGFSRNQAGEFDLSSRRTATEVEAVQQAANLRVDERRDMLADLYTRVTERFLQMIFRYWTAPKIVEVTGIEGIPYWVQFTGDQIKGEYHIQVDPDTVVPRTKRMKREEALALLKVFGQDQTVDPIALRKYVLSNFENVDAESWLRQGSMPQQPIGMDEFARAQMMARSRMGGGGAPMMSGPPAMGGM